MSSDMELSLKIQALVKGIDEVRRLHDEVNRLGRDAKEIGNAESAAYRLGVATRNALATTAGVGGLAAAAFLAVARSVITADEELNALAGRTGMAADKLAELKYAAEQSNTSIEVVARGISQFNSVVLDAQKGGQSANLFKALGLDPQELGSSETALGKVMDRLRGMNTEMASAFARKLYGEGGNQMLEFLRLGSEGLERMREEARALGITTVESAKAADNFRDAVGKLTTVVQGVVREAITPALPVLSQFIQQLVDGKRELGSFDKSLGFLFRESVLGNLNDVPKAIEASTARVEELKKRLEEVKKPTLGNTAAEALLGGVSELFTSDRTMGGVRRLLDDEERRLATLRAFAARERERAESDSKPPATGGIDWDALARSRAARDFSSQRFQVAKAEAEAELKVLQDTLARYSKEWDYALEKNLVSFRAAAQARINIQQAEIDAQIRARETELAEAEKIANDPKANEGSKLDAMAKIKTLTADITVLRQKRGDVEVDEGRKAADQEEALANKLREVRGEYLALMQQGGSGAVVRAQLEESFKSLLRSPDVSDDDKGLIRKLIDAKGAQADLRDIQAEYTRVLDEMSVAQDRISIQQRAGTLTETQARQQLIELYRQTGAEIDALIPKFEALGQASGLPEINIQLERARNKITELGAAADNMTTQFSGTLGNAAGDFFTDAATSADKFGQTAMNAINNLRRAMLNIINQRLGQILVDSIFGAISNSGTVSVGNWASRSIGSDVWHGGGDTGGASRTVRRVSPIVFAGAPRLHSGLRADEFPAILQRGERVLSRSEVAAGSDAPIINVINPPQQPQVSARHNGNAWEIDVVFKQIEGWLMDRAAKGQGLGQVFSGRFGAAVR